MFYKELLNQPRSLLKQPQRGIVQSHKLSNLILHRTHEEEQRINLLIELLNLAKLDNKPQLRRHLTC